MGSGDHHSSENYQTFFDTVEQGFWGMTEDLSGGKRTLSQSRSTAQPLMGQGWAEITWVTSLVLWNRSGADESTDMMEGKVVFKQGQLSKAPKKLRLLRPQREPQIRAPLSPFAPLDSRNPPVALRVEGKAASCRSQRASGSAGMPARDACPPVLPLGNWATADLQ